MSWSQTVGNRQQMQRPNRPNYVSRQQMQQQQQQQQQAPYQQHQQMQQRSYRHQQQQQQYHNNNPSNVSSYQQQRQSPQNNTQQMVNQSQQVNVSKPLQQQHTLQQSHNVNDQSLIISPNTESKSNSNAAKSVDATQSESNEMMQPRPIQIDSPNTSIAIKDVEAKTNEIDPQQQSAQNDENDQNTESNIVEKENDDPTPKKKPFSSSSKNNINEKMFFGTRYEVKCDETFAFYEGYVYDYDRTTDKVTVAFPWRDDQHVPVNYVRPLAPPISAHWKPKQGDHVECQAKAEESEPYGWWDCTIKTVRDNLYLITYEGWDNHHEVLQHNMLRPYNDQEPFCEQGIVKEYMKLSEEYPDKIKEFKSGAMMNAQNGSLNADEANDFNAAQTANYELKRIALQTKLIHLNYCPQTQSLMLIGQRQQVRDAKMLIKYFWDLRYEYAEKENDFKKDEEKLQKEYDDLSGCVECKFRFDAFLTKYVIGSKGTNIQKAKEKKGVIHITVRNVPNSTTSECVVLATDSYAVEEAKRILEMQQDFVLIPRGVRKELIGENGKNIQDIEKRAKVIKICTLDHLRNINQQRYNNQEQASFMDEEDCEDPSMVKMIIIGPKEKVPIAKVMISQQVDSIQQHHQFMDRRKIAEQELNSFGGGNSVSYDAGMDDNVHWDQNGQIPMNNGGGYNYNNGQRSVRRQRRQSNNYQQQQQQTERSMKDTQHFNYTNQPRAQQRQEMMNDDPQYPSLGSNDVQMPMNGGHDHNDSKDISNDEDNGYNAGKSWVEHDEAGLDEDESNNYNGQQQQQQQQRRNQNNNNNNQRNRKGKREQAGRPKQVWKAKSPSSVTQEANEVE